MAPGNRPGKLHQGTENGHLWIGHKMKREAPCSKSIKNFKMTTGEHLTHGVGGGFCAG